MWLHATSRPLLCQQDTRQGSGSLKAACDEAKKRLHGLACEDDASPLIDTRYDEVAFRDGGMYRKDDATKGETFVTILQRCAMDKIVAEGKAVPSEGHEYSMWFVRREFCEVRVDEDTGEVRVSRFLGVFDCGTIINPKTAASQWRGGITMGLGMALTEAALFDMRRGHIVNLSWPSITCRSTWTCRRSRSMFSTSPIRKHRWARTALAKSASGVAAAVAMPYLRDWQTHTRSAHYAR